MFNHEILHTFFEGLNHIMMEDIGLYRRISETTSYAFLRSECKDILKDSLRESFFKRSGLPIAKFNVYAEYVASGIIGIYTSWLISDSAIPLDELTDTAKDAVSNGWDRLTR